MISKERLEELIEQGATIYGKNGCKIDLAEKDNFLENIFSIYFKVEQNKLYRMNKDLQIAEDEWYLQNLFETEEDARWELEMTATRTETLKLANYADFENENGDRAFYHKGITYELSLWWASDNTKIIRVTWNGRDDFGWLFEKPLTKENYISACKLCLRLFKGEEV